MKPFRSLAAAVLLILPPLFSPPSRGATSFQQTITTTVPGAVNIATSGGGTVSGIIDPATGNGSALTAGFTLETNGTDANYTFILTANIISSGGASANAYAQINSQPYILFGNNAAAQYPTTAAISNITGGSPSAASNPNVIAYPVSSTSVTGASSVSMINNASYGGLCYQVLLGGAQNGTLTQNIGAAPLAGTYSVNDTAGTYQTVITFSAYTNP